MSRQCGPCTECCTALGVPELAKGPFARCSHELKKKGCAIYSRRPVNCREFNCLWLDPMAEFKRKDRPDRIGIVFATQETAMGQSIVAFVTKSGADKQGRGQELINRLAGILPVFILRADGSRSLAGPANVVRKVSEIEEHGLDGQKLRYKLRVMQ